MWRVRCSESQFSLKKMEEEQIVLSSGSPFKPKGLAHRLHLLRPPGAWFMICGPSLLLPGPLARPPPLKLQRCLFPIQYTLMFFARSSSPATSLHPSTPHSWPLHPLSPLHHLLPPLISPSLFAPGYIHLMSSSYPPDSSALITFPLPLPVSLSVFLFLLLIQITWAC